MMNIYRNTLLLTFALTFSLASAQLRFEEEEIVYKAGLLEENAEAVFHFTNIGEAPITITKVSSSCGCTVPKLSKKTYAPNESGEIKATFTFGARVGLQKKRISVQTNSTTEDQYSLSMVTDIPEWVVSNPRILRWRLDEPASPKEFEVTISDPERISISATEQELDAFNIKIINTGPGLYRYLIAPKAPLERATEFLRFTAEVTDGSTTKTRQFGVHCLIR